MAYPWLRFEPRLKLGLVAGACLPLVVLTLLRLRPHLDARWEDHRSHFGLVLGASLISVGLGYAVFVAARRRRDARLLLVSFAFIVSAGFLGLHALATPGVLVGTNPGFELATPLGLLFGGIFVAASGASLPQPVYHRLIRESRWLLAALVLVMLTWGVFSLAQLPPLNDPLQGERLKGWETILGALGVLLYALGALGYFRLYRQRHARFIFAMALSFTLLAEAMVIIAFAARWQISWWEWHTLMLGAFLLIALFARQEWREERFSALYLDETLAGTKEASIIFADLHSYTSYAEQAEATEVVDMLNTYFGQLIPLMEEMGGDVHQIIGDSIMVIFNKEGDQPDHGILAARAALAFQREASSVAQRHPDWPRFRVGVNSGEVLAGVIGGTRGHRKHGVVGDTVNLAARLETKAPVGEVVIGAGTYSCLPEGARVELLMPLQIKGKKELVAAYILHDLPDEPSTEIKASSSESEFRHAAMRLAYALWGGLISGAIVGGIGGRVCMLVLRLTSGPLLLGAETDNGFTLGRFTSATVSLAAETALLGARTAVFYLVVRRWLPERWRALVMTVLGALIGGAMFIEPRGFDFTVLRPLPLAVGMFIVLPALHGFFMTVLIERFLPFAERPRRLAFILLLFIPILVSPTVVFLCAAVGLGWAVSRRFGFGRFWTSPPLVWVGRGALMATGLFSLVTLAGDLREIL